MNILSLRDRPVPPPDEGAAPVEGQIKEVDSAIKVNYDLMVECVAVHDHEKVRKARARIDELLDKRLVLMGQRDAVYGRGGRLYL